MANCVRSKPNNQGTVAYRRHQFRNDGKCKHCGADKRKHGRTARQAFIKRASRKLVLRDGISRKIGNFLAREQWDQQKKAGE
jgi:hypothetical protein